MIILQSPDGAERIIILQRQDGTFTYRKQLRLKAVELDDDDESCWSPPGPDCGIYDSLNTAETEARLRVIWLKAQFH